MSATSNSSACLPSPFDMQQGSLHLFLHLLHLSFLLTILQQQISFSSFAPIEQHRLHFPPLVIYNNRILVAFLPFYQRHSSLFISCTAICRFPSSPQTPLLMHTSFVGHLHCSHACFSPTPLVKNAPLLFLILIHALQGLSLCEFHHSYPLLAGSMASLSQQTHQMNGLPSILKIQQSRFLSM
ncbi:hypothetical protein L7F22_042922 [Adiantum nelumboides]|nr:hypothetical protein [Adiantum nelumboides]